MEKRPFDLRLGVAIWLCSMLWAPISPAAFHDGGVASCDGCHVMHDSEEGRLAQSNLASGYSLLAESASDVCLSCHASGSGSVLGMDPLFPPPEKGAGNFVFLLEDNINDATDGRLRPISGYAAGHNLVAPGFGLGPDPRHPVAPGGTFRSADLGCTSCHDPHGRSEFRMLNGAGEIQGGIASFLAPTPKAVGIDLESGRESRNSHTAYLEGMSRWCGNCHGRYHEEGQSEFEHPIDEPLDPDIVAHYNRYDGDDNPRSGSEPFAYLPNVPFEDQRSRTEETSGASATSRVMCLTCHRAHASSAPAAGRWDFNVTLLSEDGVPSGSWPLPDPYSSPNQGSLCRKCHPSIPE